MTKLFSIISKWKENTDQLFHNKGIVRERIWANGMAKIQLIVQKENMTAKLLTHQAVHKIILQIWLNDDQREKRLLLRYKWFRYEKISQHIKIP